MNDEKDEFNFDDFCTPLFGVRRIKFSIKRKPEDKLIQLDALSESPKSKFQDFKIGGDVVIIKEDDVFDVSGRVEDVCEKLVLR